MTKTKVLELRGLIAKNGHTLRSFSKSSGISLSYLSLNVDIEDVFEFEIKEA